MKIKEINEIRHRILTEEEAEFSKVLVAAKIVDREDTGNEILSVMLDNIEGYQSDALGEFFFMPSTEEEELQFFVNLITISEDLSQDNLAELCVTVAMLNTYTETGTFAIDPVAGCLIYKNTIVMPLDLGYDEIKDNVNISMGMSLELVNEFAYLLDEVNSGKRNAKSVIDLFTVDKEDNKFEW